MFERLTTEQQNPVSEKIDQLSSLEIVELINAQDHLVAPAVRKQSAKIGQAVDAIVEAIRRGGRLIYMGAGTSGRLGVLDASECPPTFNSDPNLVVGLIAGGPAALMQAIEGAEDLPESGRQDLQKLKLSEHDIVVGIATSGRTPYVVGGLTYARQTGCTTVAVTCNEASELESVAHIVICPVVGPEVISGSTRMKAGTATKLVLNTLTTSAMIRLGKTYGNLMVDLRATNRKLRDRSRRIVALLSNITEDQAQQLLDRCGGEVKTAIVAHWREVNPEQARTILQNVGGHLRQAIGES